MLTFRKKTYGLVLLHIAVTFAATPFLYKREVEEALRPASSLLLAVGAITYGAVVVIATKARDSAQKTCLGFFVLLSLLHALFVAYLCTAYGSQPLNRFFWSPLMLSLAGTGLAVLLSQLLAFCSRRDFTEASTLFRIVLGSLLGFIALTAVLPEAVEIDLALSGGAALIFTMKLVYDTQRFLRNDIEPVRPRSWVHSAMVLSCNIVVIWMAIGMALTLTFDTFYPELFINCNLIPDLYS